MSREAKIAVGILGGAVVVVGGLALFALATFELGGHGAGKYVGEPPPVSSSPAAVPTMAAKSLLAEPSDLRAAIGFFRAGDSDDGPAPELLSLAAWASKHATVDDVDGIAVPATTPEEAMRDMDQLRGRRVCVRAEVTEIYAETIQAERVYVGGLVDSKSNILRFVAVGDVTGAVEHVTMPFCGLVIGRETFANLAGTRTRAIRLVGMFMTSANLKRRRAAPAASGG